MSCNVDRQFLHSGFTLLELLLSVALITVLAGLSLPVASRFQILTDADVAATTIAQSLRRAQALARSGDGDTTWGVSVDDSDNNKIVMFRGASYAARDTGYDEEFDLPASITPTGVSEVVFAKLTGDPDTTGTTTLTTATNQVRTITINAVGMVSY